MTFHVYVAFDAERRPLYAGQTGNLSLRMTAHKHARRWFDQAAVIFVTPFATRPEAIVAEAERISSLRPAYNRQWNPAHERLDHIGAIPGAQPLPDDRPLTIRERKRAALVALRRASA